MASRQVFPKPTITASPQVSVSYVHGCFSDIILLKPPFSSINIITLGQAVASDPTMFSKEPLTRRQHDQNYKEQCIHAGHLEGPPNLFIRQGTTRPPWAEPEDLG